MKTTLCSLFFTVPLLIGSVLADTEHRPNFIVIYCDNLGYGDVEPFGSIIHRTPNLNRMAAEGRKFTHFYVSAGVCTPSRASIMTGCYSQRVGMHYNPRDQDVLRPVSPYGLNPDEVTLAEALQAQGYATAHVGKWHLGDQLAFLPTRQGFDYFFGIPYSEDMTEQEWERDGSHWPPLPLMRGKEVIEAPADRNTLTKRYTEEAISWIEKNRDRPFFLYLPQAMPGSTPRPFASDAFRGKSKNGPWGDAIEELDWSTGKILDKLRELDLAESTLVIWTSDNGSPLAKDMADSRRGSNQPLFGRGYTTSEGAFRVPCLMWWPGRISAGTVCEELCSTMDLYPTFVNFAKGTMDDTKRDGHDITPLILGEKNSKSPWEVFAYYDRDQLQAVRSGPWKLFLPLDEFVHHPHYQKGKGMQGPLLYNVVEDIGSTKDLATQQPEIVARLTAIAEDVKVDLGDSGRIGSGVRPPGKIENPVPRVLAADSSSH